jgi:hypothetical protein
MTKQGAFLSQFGGNQAPKKHKGPSSYLRRRQSDGPVKPRGTAPWGAVPLGSPHFRANPEMGIDQEGQSPFGGQSLLRAVPEQFRSMLGAVPLEGSPGAVSPHAREERWQPPLQCDTRGIWKRFMASSFRRILIKYYYYSRDLSIPPLALRRTCARPTPLIFRGSRRVSRRTSSRSSC